MTTQAAAGSYVRSGGPFERDTDYLTERITADGRSGWPVTPGRYRLVVARACPLANRSIIVRRLLGLEPVLSMGVCGPVHGEHSWTFDLDPGGRDPVLGYKRLEQAYVARDLDYDRGVTVPAIVDIPSKQVVTNDYPQITLDLSREWKAYHRDGAPDLSPEPLRAEMDEVMELVYRDVNNAVYECGFAGSQEAYEQAFDKLFSRLDWLSQRLARQRYLVGDTIDFEHIKRHYYMVHKDINPTQIVPKGPDRSGWSTPHHREQLGGRPFGDGTPPGPPTPDELVPPAHAA